MSDHIDALVEKLCSGTINDLYDMFYIPKDRRQTDGLQYIDTLNKLRELGVQNAEEVREFGYKFISHENIERIILNSVKPHTDKRVIDNVAYTKSVRYATSIREAEARTWIDRVIEELYDEWHVCEREGINGTAFAKLDYVYGMLRRISLDYSIPYLYTRIVKDSDCISTLPSEVRCSLGSDSFILYEVWIDEGERKVFVFRYTKVHGYDGLMAYTPIDTEHWICNGSDLESVKYLISNQVRDEFIIN